MKKTNKDEDIPVQIKVNKDINDKPLAIIINDFKRFYVRLKSYCFYYDDYSKKYYNRNILIHTFVALSQSAAIFTLLTNLFHYYETFFGMASLLGLILFTASPILNYGEKSITIGRMNKALDRLFVTVERDFFLIRTGSFCADEINKKLSEYKMKMVDIQEEFLNDFQLGDNQSLIGLSKKKAIEYYKYQWGKESLEDKKGFISWSWLLKLGYNLKIKLLLIF